MSDSTSQPNHLPYFIQYYPQLISECGSQNAAILSVRLVYWFNRMGNSFYKFIEPCQHGAYKTGDSWKEELGFSKKVFKKAFDKIGIRYVSKTAFEKEDDPFKGKLFAYYQDRQTKKTIFVLNTNICSKLYSQIKLLLQKKKTPNSEGEGVSTDFKEGSPTERPLGSPHVRADKDKQINTSYQKDDLKFKGNEKSYSASTPQLKSLNNVTEMIEIWKEEVEGKGVPSLTPSIEARLKRALEDNFSNSLEDWRKHCITIASSAFLMGEKDKTTYQIQLLVAMTDKFRTQLQDGKFELNTRESAHAKKVRETREKLKNLAVSKEIVDNQITQKKDELSSSRKKKILAKVDNLTEEERGAYQKSFEADQKDCPTFQKEGWESKIIQFQFDSYLWKRVDESLEATESEAATESLQAEKGIIEKKYDQVMVYLREILACQENLAKNFSR